MGRLSRECATFCRHLIGWPPNDYVVGKYRAFHALPVAEKELRGGTLDRILLAVAVRHPLLTRLAESGWNLAATAAALGVSEAQLGLRIEAAGFGHLLRQDVLDRHRAQARDRAK